jgi:hypothetical protein
VSSPCGCWRAVLARANPRTQFRGGPIRKIAAFGDDNRRDKALATKEFTERAQGCCLVALGLSKTFPGPRLRGRRRATCTFAFPRARSPFHPDASGNHRAEFEHTSTDRLIADNYALLCQEVFDISVAQSEPEIE